MQFRTIYIPYEGRAKYPDTNIGQVVSQGSNSGGGSQGGGAGTTEYMTAFQTDTNAGSWTVSGFTALDTLEDGVAILVRFNTMSNSGLSANTIDIGVGAEGDSGETHPYPIYLKTGQLVTDEIKEGDEMLMVYRDSLSGWTIDTSNERYARDIWEFLNSGTVISKYDVASSGDVMAFGSEAISGLEFSIIDRLDYDTEPHGKYALSANMGKVLSGMVNTKQTILESGVNIKTINGKSLLGSGNIEIEGGGSGSGGTFVVGSGLTFDSATGEYRVSDSLFAEIDGKYDKTGGTVSGNVLVTGEIISSGNITSSGDVVSYGESDFSGLSLTVRDNLTTNSSTDALSARMGVVIKNTLNLKQDILQSGVNIKTINGSAITGSGNLVIETGGGGGTTYNEGSGISISNNTIAVSQAVFNEIYSKANSAGTYTGLTVGDSQKLGGSAATEFAKVSQIDDLNDALDLKYDKTGGTISGSVWALGDIAASGDVMSYGQSSIVPTGITVVDNLSANTTTATPHTNYVLSANKGRYLYLNKQDKLVSGVNIKTINGQPILGSGNMVIEGGSGGNEYYPGENIGINNYTISVTGSVKSAQTAVNADYLGGSAATVFAKTYGNYPNMNVGSAASAYDAASLGGLQANYYAQRNGYYSNLSAGTAINATKLGGVAAAGYALSSGTYTNLTVGKANSADTATKANSATTATEATKAFKWDIYSVYVGPYTNQTDNNTIYFFF